jgi:hypothetical protein
VSLVTLLIGVLLFVLLYWACGYLPGNIARPARIGVVIVGIVLLLFLLVGLLGAHDVRVP